MLEYHHGSTARCIWGPRWTHRSGSHLRMNVDAFSRMPMRRGPFCFLVGWIGMLKSGTSHLSYLSVGNPIVPGERSFLSSPTTKSMLVMSIVSNGLEISAYQKASQNTSASGIQIQGHAWKSVQSPLMNLGGSLWEIYSTYKLPKLSHVRKDPRP